jgi:hypothetical protein
LLPTCNQQEPAVLCAASSLWVTNKRRRPFWLASEVVEQQSARAREAKSFIMRGNNIRTSSNIVSLYLNPQKLQSNPGMIKKRKTLPVWEHFAGQERHT